MMIRCYIFHHNTPLCLELMDLGVKLSLAGQEELYLGGREIPLQSLRNSCLYHG